MTYFPSPLNPGLHPWPPRGEEHRLFTQALLCLESFPGTCGPSFLDHQLFSYNLCQEF